MKSVLDSRQLLAARVLATTGSFTVAGQQLSLTQSAVSHAIKALEEEVECKLFTRTGRGVKVTAAGKHFLQYTDTILAQMETARTLVSPRTASGKERLRLGVSIRAREFILPIVLPIFQREYSNKFVAIEPGDYVRNLELLQSGLLDLVFTVKPVARPEFGYVHLFEDELKFVVGPEHPWAKTGRASREDLAGGQLMLFPKVNNTPEMLAAHFRTEKMTPRHGVGMPEHESIKDLVKTNLVVGVLPPWLVTREVNEGSLVMLPLGSRPLMRQWGLAYDPKRQLTAMDQRFIELCRLAVPGILSRLQGRPLEAREKKEPAAVTVQLSEPDLKYGRVALSLAWVYSLFNDSMAWGNFGSILSAAS